MDASPPPYTPKHPIELHNVTMRLGGKTVLDGLSLTIEANASKVIIGESGSGKSVLIRLMNGLMLPDDGDVYLLGQNTKTIDLKSLAQLRRRIGTLFQNYALFDSMTVGQNIAFPLLEHTQKPPAEIFERVRELLDFLNLPDAFELRPSELSGGMKKRVSLARALITDPEVVLFDEPTTGLDPIMIEFVDQMLLDAKKKFSLTSAIISHDMASAFSLADRMAMLHNGKIIYEGSPDEVRQQDIKELKSFVELGSSRLGNRSKPKVQNNGLSDAESIKGLQFGDLAPPKVEPLAVIRDLHKSFGARKILKGVNLYLSPNEVTTIIGGSGSGKTVTMKHILGLFKPDSGSVTVFGAEISDLPPPELLNMRRRFGMLFQGAALFDSMTIRQNVAFPLVELQKQGLKLDINIDETVDDILERLKVQDLGHKTPADISGGQRKRVGLARAIAPSPDILIYDEPTTGLDPVMTEYVNDMIVEAQDVFNITALVVSHDMASTFRISHTVAMLYLGEIVAFGPPDSLISNPHPAVQEFIFAGTQS